MAKSKAVVEEVVEKVKAEANADLKAPKSAAKLEEEGDIAVVIAPGGEKSYEVVAVHYR